jgi:hypothetical protein
MKRSFQFWILVVILLHCCCAWATTPECNIDDDCQPEEESGARHHSFSWFEEASQDGLNFLQQHVFGQKETEAADNSRQESFSHLGYKEKQEGKSDGTATGGLLGSLSQVLSSDNPEDALFQVILGGIYGSESEGATEIEEGYSLHDTARIFLDHASEVLQQLKRTLVAQD